MSDNFVTGLLMVMAGVCFSLGILIGTASTKADVYDRCISNNPTMAVASAVDYCNNVSTKK